MRPFLSVLALLAVSSIFAQQNIDTTLVHQDQQRKFRIHLPAGYSSATDYAMVFVLHGGGLGTGPQVQNNTQMDVVADAGGFIVIYPDALNENWADGRGNPSDDAGVDDVGFISKVIDFMNAGYSIDVERVFSCGMSNGAFMSHRLAVNLSNRIAAIGAVAGTMGPDCAADFPPANPMPLIEFHGTSDLFVPYKGGAVVVTRGTAVGVEEVVRMYAGFDGCNAGPDTMPVANSNVLDLSTAEKFTYLNCDNQTEVVFFKITRGGHTWPGGKKNASFGSTNMDVNASQEIWNFFKNKRRVGAPQFTTGIATNVVQLLSIYPNPVSDLLTVGATDLSGYKITDSMGRDMTMNISGDKINVSEFPAGLYWIRSSSGAISFYKK